MSCNKADVLVLRLKWRHIHSRLSDFNLTPSLTEITWTHKTQSLRTNKDKISCHTKESIPLRVLCFENAVLKKWRPIFVLILHLFYNLPSVLLSFLSFATECFDKNFLNRLMILQSYLFVNFLSMNRSRLLALVDCTCGTEICA